MRKKIMWSLLSLGIIVLGIVGYYAYSFWSFADKISTDPKDSRFNIHPQTTSVGGESLTPPKWEGKERVNILLLGGDSRGLQANEIPRSDSIMIASLDPQTKKSYLFSILRDTYVKIPNNGMDRINTAISTGGPELAMKTVSDLMGIPIQYYVYTDFKGFIALVDALGGIDMDVEKDMKYQDAADNHEYDINLKKGFQHLDGKTALQYVRFRHDATSDFTRTERQRKFMKAVAEKLKSTSSLIKLPKILQAVDPYIETNLSVSQMLKLASLGYEVKTDGMVSQQIPPMELLEEKRVGGAEVLGVNPAKLQAFIKGLFGDTSGKTGTSTSGVLSMEADDNGSKTSAGSGIVAGSGSGTKSSGTASSGTKSSSASATRAPSPTVKATPSPKATVKPAAPTPKASSTAKAPAPGATPTPKSTSDGTSTGTDGTAGGSGSGSTGGKTTATASPKTSATKAPAATPTATPAAKEDLD